MVDSAPTAAPRSGPSLIFFVALLGLLELLLNRVLGALPFIDLLPRHGRELVLLAGRFAHEWAFALTAIVLGLALGRIATGRAGLLIATRVSLVLVGSVELTLAFIEHVDSLPGRLLIDQQLGQFSFALLTVLVVFLRPCKWRHKLGAVALLVPIALSLGAAVGLGPSGIPLRTLAEISAAVAAPICAACFLPTAREAHLRIGAFVALFLTVAMLLLLREDWATTSRLSARVFAMDLPVTPWQSRLYLVALGAMLFTTVSLFTGPARSRLTGSGLLLILLGGLSVADPYHALVCLLGFLCVADAVGETEPLLTIADFKALCAELGSALGSDKLEVHQRPFTQVAKIHSAQATLFVVRRNHRLHRFEILLGDPPLRHPSLSIAHQDSTRLGPSADAPSVRIGDPDFDAQFVIHDRRGTGSALLDEATRQQIAANLRGWLGIWPQRGLRYTAHEVSRGPALLAQLALLRRMAEKSEIVV